MEEVLEKLPYEFLYKEIHLGKVINVPEEYANDYRIAGVVPFDDNGSIALYIHLVKKA